MVSHESALVLHELSELLPGAIHLTVPPKFRKQAPPGCVLHRARLQPDEAEERQGFRVTSPLRTLLDVAEGDTSQEQLAKAVADALARGLVRKKSLEKAMMTQGPASERLQAAVEDRATTGSVMRIRSEALWPEPSAPQLPSRRHSRPVSGRSPPNAPCRSARCSFAFVAAIPDGTMIDSIRVRLQEAVDIDLGDYLSYRIGLPKHELTNAPGGGARFPCEAILVGKTYAKFHLDVGFGDVPVEHPDRLVGDDVLSFAGIAPATAVLFPRHAIRRESARVYLSVVRSGEHPHEGSGQPRPAHRAGATRDRPAPRSCARPSSSTARTHALPGSLQPPPVSWGRDFPGMAEEAGLSTRNYLEAFAILERYGAGHSLGS